MRVLLISQRQEDREQIVDLLDSLSRRFDESADIGGAAGEPDEVHWCPARPEDLPGIPVVSCDLIIWGEVPDMPRAMRLLSTLNESDRVPPIVLLTDDVPDLQGRTAQPDILSRAALGPDALITALRHVRLLPERVPRDVSAASTTESAPTIADSPDPLTGLSNRQGFHEQLDGLLRHSQSAGSVGLLLIDIDQFKRVNASYGQGAGDALIQLIAERIRSSLSPTQRLARIGGNEFAVIFQHAVGSVDSEVRHRVEAIIQSMETPFPVAQHAVRMNVSMGAVIQSDETDVDTLLAHADMAMRVAKQQTGSTCQFYTRDMTDSAHQVLRLEAEIRRGLRKEEFVLHFQPRIDVARQRIVGAEALIRWNHPSRGLLSPGAFIAVAEDSGLIVPLGYWIIHQACKCLNQMAANGFTDSQIAVNVAFKQFQDKNFVRTVDNILKKHEISPGRLEFELTETTMMVEGHFVDESLRKLSRLGIDISLDDFGTGYSSFAHIQRLPISALKVDRTFVGNVLENEDDATIVRAMINLAHSLNMQVIAEGAETVQQVGFLADNDCDQIQGYYFSRPVAFDELLRLMANEELIGPLFRGEEPVVESLAR